MRDRIQAGGGIAALFFGVGALGTAHKWSSVITFALFGLAALSLLVAFANRLPLLHLIPLVGAPRLKATLTVDGRDGSTVRIPQGKARDFLICVGVHNPDRLEVDPGHINFLMSEGIRRWKCDHNGRPDSRGQWMRPTNERIGDDDPHAYKDYWAFSRAFPGSDDVVSWFRVRFKRPGEYRFRFKINASVLYREFKKDFRIEVVSLDGDPTPVERIDALLDEGEKWFNSRPDKFGGDPAGQNYMNWLLMVYDALPDEHVELFKDTAAEDIDPNASSTSIRDEWKAALAVLYEIRRRMAV
jgi:hypothetical protein